MTHPTREAIQRACPTCGREPEDGHDWITHQAEADALARMVTWSDPPAGIGNLEAWTESELRAMDGNR